MKSIIIDFLKKEPYAWQTTQDIGRGICTGAVHLTPVLLEMEKEGLVLKRGNERQSAKRGYQWKIKGLWMI